MQSILATILILIAGAMNGSYAQPVKHMKQWPQAFTWLVFSGMAFVAVPLTSSEILLQHPFAVLHLLPTHEIGILIGGGLLFGIGMICFTACYRLLGLGVSFILNIALGTVFGALLPIFFRNPQKLLTLSGIINLFALLLFVIAVIGTCRAASLRDQHKKTAQSHHAHSMKELILGLTLGVLSGIFCSFQGAAYGYCLPSMNEIANQHHISTFATANLLWLPIFVAAFVPYALHHFHLFLRSKTKTRFYANKYYWFYIIIMGCMYYLPLILYSFAVQKMGALGTGFGWPLLMSAIVLTSNFWGWQQGEWKQAPNISLRLMKRAIVLMIIAIILLSLGAHINIIAHNLVKQ